MRCEFATSQLFNPQFLHLSKGNTCLSYITWFVIKISWGNMHETLQFYEIWFEYTFQNSTWSLKSISWYCGSNYFKASFSSTNIGKMDYKNLYYVLLIFLNFAKLTNFKQNSFNNFVTQYSQLLLIKIRHQEKNIARC